MKTNFSKRTLSILGLFFVTMLSCVNAYVKTAVSSSNVATGLFLSVSYAVGIIFFLVFRLDSIKGLNRKTLKRGLILAAEACGFNILFLNGSINVEPVVSSSFFSIFFIFVAILLILMKKKTNYMSLISSLIAVIALILMCGENVTDVLASENTIYFIAADIVFAIYVVTISRFCRDEDPASLAFSMTLFSLIIYLAGWLMECAFGAIEFSIPTHLDFWITAIVYGIVICVIYRLVQYSCMKNITVFKASLVFSSEIIFAILLAPLMHLILGTDVFTPTIYQITGCIMFLTVIFLADKKVMGRLGYDFDEFENADDQGRTDARSSISKKMTVQTLSFTLIAIMLSITIGSYAIYHIKNDVMTNSEKLLEKSTSIGQNALRHQLNIRLYELCGSEAEIANKHLNDYAVIAEDTASIAGEMYNNPSRYKAREVQNHDESNSLKKSMHISFESEDVIYSDVESECVLFENMVDIFAPIVENSEDIETIFLATNDGLLISYEDEASYEEYIPYYEMDWYQKAKDCEDYVFSSVYRDAFSGNMVVTCSAPFYDSDGNFKGCVCVDILLDKLNQNLVSDNITEPNSAMIIDKNGMILSCTDSENSDLVEKSIYSDDYVGPVKEIGSIIIESEGRGLMEVTDDETFDNEENANFVSYAYIESAEWYLIIISPADEIIEHTAELKEEINDSTDELIDSVDDGFIIIVDNCLILFAVVLVLIVLLIGRFSRKITDPIKQLENDVNRISQGDFKQHTLVQTDDEIGSLADSFNIMTDAISTYMENLKKITAKEERIASELAVATRIQESMLPRKFPAFPDHKEFDIYASMNAAKEVGGDFYDFFLIDNDHLALVMADVSGKGVPAALFMVNVKMQIKTRSLQGGSPSEILYDVNNIVCENNDEMMFVTVWFAIVDLRTGEGYAVNAGHEHPAIRRGRGRYDLCIYSHELALGCMDGMEFAEHKFKLFPGDSLFVYTDGLTEATNSDSQLFGDKRLVDALNIDSNATMQQCFDNLQGAISDFVGDAEQFDDMTMMRFDYLGGKNGEDS